MHIVTRDVNTAFHEMCLRVKAHQEGKPVDGLMIQPQLNESASRNGEVLRFPEPVTMTYLNPLDRVLFNRNRHANPFFHVIESLWMLVGSRDVATLSKFNNQVKEYSDDGKVFHGAYGHRWRFAFNTDQLLLIIKILTKDSNSRRVVLQMWSARDLAQVDSNPSCKDVPCNTHAYFDIRHEPATAQGSRVGSENSYLDMTVCNRSNDMIWGMLGANYVHFSFLQEYLAHAIGVKVGFYHHITNNLHIYTGTETYHKNGGKLPSNSSGLLDYWLLDRTPNCYTARGIYARLTRIPLLNFGTPVSDFNEEVHDLLHYIEEWPNGVKKKYNQQFLEYVARPMVDAYHHYRAKNFPLAISSCHQIMDGYWRTAALDWMNDSKSKPAPKTLPTTTHPWDTAGGTVITPDGPATNDLDGVTGTTPNPELFQARIPEIHKVSQPNQDDAPNYQADTP